MYISIHMYISKYMYEGDASRPCAPLHAIRAHTRVRARNRRAYVPACGLVRSCLLMCGLGASVRACALSSAMHV